MSLFTVSQGWEGQYLLSCFCTGLRGSLTVWEEGQGRCQVNASFSLFCQITLQSSMEFVSLKRESYCSLRIFSNFITLIKDEILGEVVQNPSVDGERHELLEQSWNVCLSERATRSLVLLDKCNTLLQVGF